MMQITFLDFEERDLWRGFVKDRTGSVPLEKLFEMADLAVLAYRRRRGMLHPHSSERPGNTAKNLRDEMNKGCRERTTVGAGI
jgi:hypothetical protein